MSNIQIPLVSHSQCLDAIVAIKATLGVCPGPLSFVIVQERLYGYTVFASFKQADTFNKVPYVYNGVPIRKRWNPALL